MFPLRQPFTSLSKLLTSGILTSILALIKLTYTSFFTPIQSLVNTILICLRNYKNWLKTGVVSFPN